MTNRSRTRTTTDRERIAAALVELSSRGYLIPFAPWEVCCATCGWDEVRRQFGIPEDENELDDSWSIGHRTVWWHEQSDAYGFAGDPGFVLHTDEFLALIPDDDHEAEEWVEDHQAEAMADTAMARTTKYVDLCAVLQLHWLGDPDEIVAALRAQGLRTMRPESTDECIAILPTVSSFAAQVSMGEVILTIDGHSTMISPKDAKRLARLLQATAKKAEADVLPEF